jgi:hypothetical protein
LEEFDDSIMRFPIGKIIAARMAMIAITTNNSTRVKPIRANGRLATALFSTRSVPANARAVGLFFVFITTGKVIFISQPGKFGRVSDGRSSHRGIRSQMHRCIAMAKINKMNHGGTAKSFLQRPRESRQWEGHPPAWPKFQPHSGVSA